MTNLAQETAEEIQVHFKLYSKSDRLSSLFFDILGRKLWPWWSLRIAYRFFSCMT